MHKDEWSCCERIKENGREDSWDLSTQEICVGENLLKYIIKEPYRMLKGEQRIKSCEQLRSYICVRIPSCVRGHICRECIFTSSWVYFPYSYFWKKPNRINDVIIFDNLRKLLLVFSGLTLNVAEFWCGVHRGNK